MSFILDALRKSETDRQQQGTAEFSGVPTSERREQPPRWLWILGVLLAINVLVLLGLLLRPTPQPALAEDASMPATIQTRTDAVATPETSASRQENFAEQVAAARQNAPPREETRPPVAEPISAGSQASPAPRSSQAVDTIALPTIHELVANGTISLPDLHVDVHVYSEAREDRFVFINMSKHVEGSRLAEGPLVREITPDGVVLVQDGNTFLLPRD